MPFLVCHALTGDQHVANQNPVTGKDGWWETMVGPGKPIDTERFFVLCANLSVGGCMGTTGPASTNPVTGAAYGLDLPLRHHCRYGSRPGHVNRSSGIDMLFCAAAAPMGGMQVLHGRQSYPERVYSALPIATPQTLLAEHRLPRSRPPSHHGRPDWRNGRYLAQGVNPAKGLAVARMRPISPISQIPRCRGVLGRKLQDRAERTFSFGAIFRSNPTFAIQGTIFVERFDPNSYLFMTRAMDYFDLAADYDGLARRFNGSKTRFCVVSFTSDWLFPTSDSRALVHALNAGGASVSFVEIETEPGTRRIPS